VQKITPNKSQNKLHNSTRVQTTTYKSLQSFNHCSSTLYGDGDGDGDSEETDLDTDLDEGLTLRLLES